MSRTEDGRKLATSLIAVSIVMVLIVPLLTVIAAPTPVTAYKSQYPVNVMGAYQSSQWSDTSMLNESTSGMMFAVKQNGTGWLFLMIWNQSSIYCFDDYCFGGIELGYLNNTQVMGTQATPTIMILASRAFKGNVDEFIAKGQGVQISVETVGYQTQSTCGLTLTSGQYIVECYRPFKLTNATSYDFPTLGVGSTIELGFAVGELSLAGTHLATDMSTYVLTFSSQTYPSTTTSSSTSSSASSSSTSTTVSTTTSNSTTSSTSTTGSSTTSNSTTSSTSTGSTSTSVSVSSASTNVSTYAEELLVMVIGFSVLVLVALARYGRS